MIHAHVLAGCTPVPLAHYLKGLAVLRLVAEQKDPAATGCWQGERFVLHTVLDRAELERFFLEEYRATPIIAPWNGGSGFYPRDSRKGIEPLASAAAARFRPYREVIAMGRRLVGDRDKSPKTSEKERFLARLRAELPDHALEWFDAAVLLAGDRVEYPPLLGTGGNDGRLDFTNNFMQRLIDLFSPDNGMPSARAAAWLRAALRGGPAAGLPRVAIGQFAPGQVGGPNGTTGFDAASLANPWDFVLMLEGGLLFAGAATRRLESGDSAAPSFPFTVRTTGAGSGSAAPADEKPARAEIWMPLWQRPAALGELRALLAEGRITVGRRAAVDGLDFARAVGSLGVDRGLDRFQRFGFLMRSGKAYLAAPLGRLRVSRSPGTRLVDQLDRGNWLTLLRRHVRQENAGAELRSLVRRLEDGIFSLAGADGRTAVQDLLVLLGRIQARLAAAAGSRKDVTPMPLLGPQWVLAADDGSTEFRLACGLAGLADMRSFVLPVAPDNGGTTWRPGSARAVWTGGGAVSGLVRILDRRLLEARQGAGFSDPFAGGPRAMLADVLAFLAGTTDDRRLADLFAGLVNVRLPGSLDWRPGQAADHPPAMFRVLKPLFTPAGDLERAGILPESGTLPLPADIVRLLATGDRDQAARALDQAWRRLRIAGLRLPPGPPPRPHATDFRRLAVALAIPLSHGDLRRTCRPFMEQPEHTTTEQGGPRHDA